VSSEAYSSLKAGWHLDKIALLRLGEPIVPPHVQLILSDLCNQDCAFCSYRMSNGFSSENFVEHKPDGTINRNPNRMIPFGKAVEILHDCAAMGVKAIQFTGGGEPTVHPRHMDLFRLALDLGLECALVTNGVVLRNGWESVLPHFKWIRVSLDAGTQETYAKVRNTNQSSFGKALDNTKAIADAIAKEGSDCLLGVGYVVTPDNCHEIWQGCSEAHKAGAKYIRLSAMFSKDFDAPFLGVEDKINERIREAKSDFDCRTFQVIDRFHDRISDLEQHAPDYDRCGYQHFNVYIGGDQKVYRCCNTAYTLHGEVGDLRQQTFSEWMASAQRREAYATFNARSCSICQFNGPNRVINSLVDEPLHANFV